MAEKIKVDIAASYDDKEAKKALKDAEAIDKLKPEFEVNADVSRALNAFDQVVAETKEVAAAAEALGAALGSELAAKADTTAIVQDLRQMGVTLDDIKGNADAFAAKLKEASDVDVGGKLGSSLGTARGKMDELSTSAGSSRSVLANMIGNTTQDLGAMTGLAGSAGVAIGQIGEYAADAAFSGDKLGTVFKNMALVVGPIAALATAVGVITNLMGEQKAAAEEAARRTKLFGDAMQGAADDSVGLAESLRENTEILTRFDASTGTFGANLQENLAAIGRGIPLVGGLMGDLGRNMNDLTDDMEAAGFSVYDFAKAIETGGRIGDEWWHTLNRANEEGKITNKQFSVMSEAISKMGMEWEDAQEFVKLYNVDQAEANALMQEALAQSAPLEHFTDKWKTLFDDMCDGAIDTKESAEAINFLAEALGITQTEVVNLAVAEKERQDGLKTGNSLIEQFLGLTEAATEAQAEAAEKEALRKEILEGIAQAHRDNAAAILEEVDAQRAAVDSTFALHDAEADFAETQATVNDELKEAKDLYEARSILENYAQSAGKVADAMVRVADDTATANGKVLTAQQRTDIWNDSMLDAAATMDGPQRTAVLNYVAAVNDIPPEKLTEIESLIDQGKLDEAKRKLDEVSATRKAAIEADAQTAEAEENLNRTARPRTAEITVVSRGGIRYSAAGSGNFGGGSTWVGEDGPELVNLPSGSQIIPANVSSAMAHNGQAGAAPMVVNINMPKGSRGVDVLRQVTQQARRSGRRYGTPVVHYARR